MSTMTPEEIIEFYNFKTEENLKRIRENLTTADSGGVHGVRTNPPKFSKISFFGLGGSNISDANRLQFEIDWFSQYVMYCLLAVKNQ